MGQQTSSVSQLASEPQAVVGGCWGPPPPLPVRIVRFFAPATTALNEA
jgi:hypothetical protein